MPLFVLAVLAGVAQASPARVAALSGNTGYIDDADFLTYPSEVAEVGNNAFLNYGGAMDGGASWEGRALYMSRTGVPNDPLGLGIRYGAGGGWRLGYFQGKGATGWSVRAAYDENGGPARSGGATWSKGDFTSGVKNLAVGGDLTAFNDPENLEIGLRGAVIGRHVEADRSSAYGAGLAFDTMSDTATIAGTYNTGPRVEKGPLIGSLTVGPAIQLAVWDGNFDMSLWWLVTNLAVEVPIKEWIVARGSAWAAPRTNFDGETFTGLSLNGNGAAGVGIRAQYFDLDASVQPTWLLNGPFFLSGSGSPMLGLVSLKVPL